MIYTPSNFQEKDEEKVFKFIKSHPFATLISCSENSISNITKIPLLLKKEDGRNYLEGHLAKSNPHFKTLLNNSSCSLIFDGAHDYISPTWYNDSDKSVPTWNYSTVAIEGIAKIIESSDWILSSIMELTDKFEKDNYWKQNIDKKLLNGLSNAIIGIRIEVKKVYPKFKMSQNKTPEERINITKELENINPNLAKEMSIFSKV